MAPSNPYGKLPQNASSSIKPFTVNFPEADIKHMLDLLKLTRVAEPIYENSLPNDDRYLGLRHDWLVEAKRVWENEFNWRKTEEHINSFPNYKITIDDKVGKLDVHFAALFSTAPDAVPVVLLHGWPGSFLEFLPMLGELRDKYSADDLKYHFIVPSLPGYTLSSAQAISEDFSQIDAARVMDKLMQELGFSKGYIAQGGDVGSRVARVMAVEYEACKAVHLNFCLVNKPPASLNDDSITEIEKAGLKRLDEWKATGTAYAMEHATKPATIGFVLSSNPLATLAWIGEKFLDWTDEDPSINTILESVTLYWLTRCPSTNLWSYRHPLSKDASQSYSATAKGHDHPDYHIKKPFGYSYFPQELIPIPIEWVKTTGNLVWSRVHDRGGHFAALERPRELLEDVESFVGEVWKR
ncbi:uncharacterized protein HMPREF1541_01971 [Cyphellophora europaea CBS 101466]|uniref:Epoxide hydrolase N-terminal domain-containing protein n=1 Tax=Cyphellophora europaea (strain CBS 101466) TaxID=1220924 RepID=W2S433_CYPE1|nr:uncharacterized protein HMPREF1541_01971 [Cyphellophora europaea CBS 101466]ETN42813.1 hypothetical protein HMPREF1541_01971 [Cyphellophora europaea CBS 101466]